MEGDIERGEEESYKKIITAQDEFYISKCRGWGEGFE